jgi:large subunit ribosomal protein L23
MAFLDILRSRKREETRPKRPPKGALKRVERPVKKQGEISARGGSAFGGKKPKQEKKEEEHKEELKLKTKQSALAATFLLGPHITERTASLAKINVYTFKVSPSANKVLVKKAIKEMFGFEPIKIRVINVPLKKRIVRGKIGIKSGYKKALVYLKEGDKIEFV